MLTLKSLFDTPVRCSACKAELCKLSELEAYAKHSTACLYCGSKFKRPFEPDQISIVLELQCS